MAQLLSIPGIRAAAGSTIDSILRRASFERFSTGRPHTVTPARVRVVFDGKPSRSAQPLYHQTDSELNPIIRPIRLAHGRLFRIVTNIELVSEVLIATACNKPDFTFFDLTLYLEDVRRAVSIASSSGLAYADLERTTAKPATVTWPSVKLALSKRLEQEASFERLNIFPTLTRLGLELEETVLLGLAVNARRLTAPLDVTIAHHERGKAVDETYGLVVNEFLNLSSIRLLTETALSAGNKWLVGEIRRYHH